MLFSLRYVGLGKAIAAASLTLLVGLALTPAHAGSVRTVQKQAAGRGWQVFLPPSIVHRPTGVAIDLRGPKHAAQWGYVADAGTGRVHIYDRKALEEAGGFGRIGRNVFCGAQAQGVEAANQVDGDDVGEMRQRHRAAVLLHHPLAAALAGADRSRRCAGTDWPSGL